MKMTEFEVGKKYTLPKWTNAYVAFDEGGCLISDKELTFGLHISLLKAEDWQEYKEPVDYGTQENPKLMLVRYANEKVWIEGYAHPNGLDEILACTTGADYVFPKCRVLKVIDLPSKEL